MKISEVQNNIGPMYEKKKKKNFCIFIFGWSNPCCVKRLLLANKYSEKQVQNTFWYTGPDDEEEILFN